MSHPDQFHQAEECQLFFKACHVVPMSSQDCSKLLTLLASAPLTGAWERRTESVWVVQ